MGVIAHVYAYGRDGHRVYEIVRPQMVSSRKHFIKRL